MLLYFLTITEKHCFLDSISASSVLDGFCNNALYKLTFYLFTNLLTYLRNNMTQQPAVSCIVKCCSLCLDVWLK